MANHISRTRFAAFKRQSGLCYYCGTPMWLDSINEFADKYRISENQARLLACTAEHYIARQDGGVDLASNIVAACLSCNQRRHRNRKKTEPAKYRALVRRRMRLRRWHNKWVHQKISGS